MFHGTASEVIIIVLEPELCAPVWISKDGDGGTDLETLICPQITITFDVTDP